MKTKSQEIFRLPDLVEGKRYHHLSPISGEPGTGTVFFQMENGKKEFYYQGEFSRSLQKCKPCSLVKFVEAESIKKA